MDSQYSESSTSSISGILRDQFELPPDFCGSWLSVTALEIIQKPLDNRASLEIPRFLSRQPAFRTVYTPRMTAGTIIISEIKKAMPDKIAPVVLARAC